MPLNGSDLIREERLRQEAIEGWTPQHDDKHDEGELARAAATYTIYSALQVGDPDGVDETDPGIMSVWPWDETWWKPTDPIRNLTKAGALIAAEIDRLLRIKERDANQQASSSNSV